MRRWNTAIPIEKVRYAAVNHLYVKVMYRKQGAHFKEYILAPYSLRKTQTGELLLYAVKDGEDQAKAFRVDWMRTLEVTGKPFVPRFKIEFASAGFINAPKIRRAGR
jgi:hypothetical protein